MERPTARKLHLDVLTPERLLIRTEVEEVVAPGLEGEFGVLPGHCHFLSSLKMGELRYRQGDQWHYLSVVWGYAQVQPDRVTVLAELAERAEEIDLERAEAAVRTAEAQMTTGRKREELEAARKDLEKALLRVRTKRKARNLS
jgi:F-type H+-transporting ATPase subunit epsilon